MVLHWEIRKLDLEDKLHHSDVLQAKPTWLDRVSMDQTPNWMPAHNQWDRQWEAMKKSTWSVQLRNKLSWIEQLKNSRTNYRLDMTSTQKMRLESSIERVEDMFPSSNSNCPWMILVSSQLRMNSTCSSSDTIRMKMHCWNSANSQMSSDPIITNMLLLASLACLIIWILKRALQVSQLKLEDSIRNCLIRFSSLKLKQSILDRNSQEDHCFHCMTHSKQLIL